MQTRHYRIAAALIWFFFAALLLYVGLVGALYLAQRSLMYFPRPERTAPADAGFPQAQEIVLDTSDGEKVIAWYVAARPARPIVLFFHGNGDVLAGLVGRFRELTESGVGLLALSYRGYAGSTGHPSEDGLHRDAMAAYEFAAARYAPDRIVLWGFSLGSGVAVALASEQPIGRLILEAPYTSAVDIAASLFPIAPVRLMMRDRFHSDRRIERVRVPLLVMHGDNDPTVPLVFGERLFALAHEPKQFVRFRGGGHNDLDDFGAMETARHFIDGLKG